MAGLFGTEPTMFAWPDASCPSPPLTGYGCMDWEARERNVLYGNIVGRYVVGAAADRNTLTLIAVADAAIAEDVLPLIAVVLPPILVFPFEPTLW
jgi:hypothetical protein